MVHCAFTLKYGLRLQILSIVLGAFIVWRLVFMSVWDHVLLQVVYLAVILKWVCSSQWYAYFDASIMWELVRMHV